MSFLEIIDIIKWRLGNILPNKWKKKWLFIFFIGCWAILFRKPILQGIGNFLITEDKLQKSDAIFVLGGNVFDRSTHSVYLYQNNFSDTIIPVGESVAKILLSTDNQKPDAVLSKSYMINKLNTPKNAIKTIIKGTSTKEEADEILKYSINNNYKKIIIVSDKFHLRRVKSIFNKTFKDSNIDVFISGAPSSSYIENYWWNYEDGLIMVNNEYVKLVYYMIKY